MKGKACCCYRFTVSKLIIMKKIFIIRLLTLVYVVAIFSSCSCDLYCGLFRVKSGGAEARKVRNECEAICKTYGVVTNRNRVDTTGKETSEKVRDMFTGEVFSTTITLGPTLNFKSSNEDYGGGYGNHKPGIGFNVGVGTVLPFNKNWAVAPSIRFTQKNASEELGYSDPGGGGGMQFTDKYSYNYLGATMLAQYRAGKHVSIVAGPEINFLVASRVKNGGSSGTGEKQSLNKSSNKVGLDLLAGIKFEIPAKNSRSKWGIQLMYDHRLSRLNKKKDETGQDVAAYKMKSIQLGLAYNICGSCGKK
jgi:hypothetical protein